MQLTNQQAIQLQLCFDTVNSFKGAKIVDPENAGSLIEGIEDALVHVAMAYRMGAGVKKDINEAIAHLLDAIKLGSGNAADDLGNIFNHDDWWEKKSYDFTPDSCYEMASRLWKMEVQNGSSDAAWSLYNSFKKGSMEAKKWSSIAIELAKKSGDHEGASWMEDVFKSDQIRYLKTVDFLTVPINHLEIYFREDPPGGAYNDDRNREEIKMIQQNLLNKISEITRSLNDEEKKEIERLKELCRRDV